MVRVDYRLPRAAPAYVMKVKPHRGSAVQSLKRLELVRVAIP